jgi:hypothetical protein
MSDQYTRQTVNAVKGQTVRYATWPVLGGAGVGGVVLTSGAGVWGVYADVVAAAAIATEFWACGAGHYTGDTVTQYQFNWQNTTLTTPLFAYSFQVTVAATLNVGPFMVPFPVYCAGGTQVQARLGSTAAKTVAVYLIYATGL